MAKHRRTNNLKWLRVKKGFTQTRLAKRIGMSQSTYAQLENGNRPASDEELEDIARHLEVDLAELGYPAREVARAS